MDEGLPIAYEVLEKGIPVYAADGEAVGTVDHVVSAPAEDIFHGIVMHSNAGARFVAADQIASLHERGVDLRIDSATVRTLPEPHGGAPAWKVHEPGAEPTAWDQFLSKLSGAARWRRNWSEED